MNSVLAEERRELLRQALPPGPRHPPAPTPVSLQGWIARGSAVLLVAASVGITGGLITDDRSTGVALGIAAGIIGEALVLQRK